MVYFQISTSSILFVSNLHVVVNRTSLIYDSNYIFLFFFIGENIKSPNIKVYKFNFHARNIHLNLTVIFSYTLKFIFCPKFYGKTGKTINHKNFITYFGVTPLVDSFRLQNYIPAHFLFFCIFSENSEFVL